MLKTKEEIAFWLDEVKVKNYHINDDLTVDVDGSVILQKKGLTEIPVQFGIVNGDFLCLNNQLTSCKGFPRIVKETLNCSGNQITSLIGCSESVTKFYCVENQ